MISTKHESLYWRRVIFLVGSSGALKGGGGGGQGMKGVRGDKAWGLTVTWKIPVFILKEFNWKKEFNLELKIPA